MFNLHERFNRHHKFGFHPRHKGPFGGGGPFGEDGEGPFGRPPFGAEGPGRFRQRRGDVKLVLLELIQEQPRHGYDLIKALEQRSGGFYRPSAGTVYPTLQLLEEEGSVTSTETSGKKIYTITEAGKKMLAEQDNHERPFGPRWGRHHNHEAPQMLEAWQSMMALRENIIQVARFGTPDQINAVKALIESTNQQIHTIMADKNPSDKI